MKVTVLTLIIVHVPYLRDERRVVLYQSQGTIFLVTTPHQLAKHISETGLLSQYFHATLTYNLPPHPIPLYCHMVH